MASKKGGGRSRGGQQQIKGFRPGKAPAQLKKQMAKAQLGSDATWLQKQTVEAIAGRTPQEVQATVRKWSVGLGAGAALLAVLGFFLYRWSVAAGVVVHVLTAVLIFLAYRLKTQGRGLAEMAGSL
jgi:hypothetical protein